MKKIMILLLSALLALALCACGAEKAEDSADAEENPGSLSTPFAELSLPEEFEDNVESEVTSEDPYTISFKAKDDGTELFSLVFGGDGEDGILMGTLPGEDENTVVYMQIPELEEKDKNYDSHASYQEGVNTIMDGLAKDNGLVIDQIVEKEDDSTFDIKTSVVTMKYPAKWQDKVTVKVGKEKVKFSNGDTPLFELVFKKCDGFLLGTYDGTPIYIVDYKVDNDEQAAMQEDVNVILQYLMEDKKFKINY